ncbi:unnamed protein product [Mytilus coruscus]|uniref:Uncharacterized protein n=1 Tax=Mytilus coruscus TaxID=42192 RepID=A0A6J8C860_MYTCO|nr:unnamed protein product [Mytilus coruscus]
MLGIEFAHIFAIQRLKKKKVLENVESKKTNNGGSEKKNVVQWISDKSYISEKEYDEIADSSLSDIKTATHEENKMDTDEDECNNQSIKTDDNEDYLNPYQPIVSMEADVHQYSSTKNDNEDYLNPYQPIVSMEVDVHQYSSTKNDNEDYLNPYQPIVSMEVDVHQYSSTKNQVDLSTIVDENQRDSGYLHPYHSLPKNYSHTKHEYTGLEKLDIEIQEISRKEKIITTKTSTQ